MTIVGNSISMREGDYVFQYMGILNPDSASEQYEQWSCVNQYEPANTTVLASVYNYQYGSPLLTSEEAERNGDNIDYQTFYHPDYTLEGPWTMAYSREFYKAKYDFYNDFSATTCTGFRKEVAENARFNPQQGEEMSVKMGFRVYTNENDQIARYAKDYDTISFNLMGASSLAATATAIIATTLLM